MDSRKCIWALHSKLILLPIVYDKSNVEMLFNSGNVGNTYGLKFFLMIFMSNNPDTSLFFYKFFLNFGGFSDTGTLLIKQILFSKGSIILASGALRIICLIYCCVADTCSEISLNKVSVSVVSGSA